jgi:hypothetical protein
MTRREQVTALLASGLTVLGAAQQLGLPWRVVYREARRDLYQQSWRGSSRRYRRARGAPKRRCPHCYGAGHAERTCPERSAA